MIAWAYRLAAVLALCGCTTAGKVTLDPLPAWIQPANAEPIPSANVAIAARRLAPNATIRFSDNVYTPVSHAWLESYMDWTWGAAKAAGVSYSQESFDCDDFSVLFRVLASRAAAKAGVRTSPLIALIVVLQPDGNKHELIAVATDKGIFMVEPQPDAGPFRITPLASYHMPILSVSFGD